MPDYVTFHLFIVSTNVLFFGLHTEMGLYFNIYSNYSMHIKSRLK